MTQAATGTSLAIDATAASRPPMFSGFSHVSLRVRDMHEAVRFFTEVLGAAHFRDLPDFQEVKLAGMVFGFSDRPGHSTAPEHEFPHYAFFIEPDDFLPMKQRLESFGVPTHQIWTRNHVESLMYFRDPSGNLFEIYCAKGLKGVESLPVPPSMGGDFVVDFPALAYETWGRKENG